MSVMPDDHSRIARIEEAQKSILRTLDEMHADALRREEKIDAMKVEYFRFETHRNEVCRPLHKRIDELDLRVRALEAFKWRAVGAVGVITFIANLVAQKL